MVRVKDILSKLGRKGAAPLDKTMYLGNTPPSSPNARNKIGKYDIVSEIGRGAMGVVLLGKDPYIKRKVAIKIVNPTRIEQVEKSEAYKARFFLEAQAAGNLYHPNIVTIYDANEVEGLCFIVMEYIQGRTLEELCRQGQLPLEQVVQIGIRVCHALDYAHQRQVIHRDVKPGNIMISDEGEVKIADFGIAYMPSSQPVKEYSIMGTPYYLSPEQILGKPVAASSDLFSLGIVLYELVCGKRPFEGDDVEAVLQQILEETPESVSHSRANVPRALERVIDRALSKAVEQRYHDGIAFARDLENSLKAPGSVDLEPSLRAKVEQLKSLFFFKDFSEAEVEAFLRVGSWMAFRECETIVYQDEKDSSFYIIVSGDVRVEAQGKTLAQLQRGDCFGELAFLLRGRRVASVIAQQDCQLLKLSEVMIPLLPAEVQLRVYQSFARVLAEKLVAMDRRYLELS